jgi:hypothetical protein
LVECIHGVFWLCVVYLFENCVLVEYVHGVFCLCVVYFCVRRAECFSGIDYLETSPRICCVCGFATPDAYVTG